MTDHSTLLSSSSSSSATTAKPIDISGWPERFPAKELCSKCGLCETSFVANVSDSCAFLGLAMGRIDDLEISVHGRQRRHDDMVWSSKQTADRTIQHQRADEGRFGVMAEPMKLAKGRHIEDAQWTGVVTSIALSMLESNQVDAVVCIANRQDRDEEENHENKDKSTWTSPKPIIAKSTDEVMRGRGVKPALAPSLRVLDEIRNDSSIRRLLFCGVGCAVQAFRTIQDDLGLDEVFVLGTNCADNSPTPQAANKFIVDGVQISSDDATRVQGYEFMQDFKVHVKMDDMSYIKRPYFSLPGTIAEESIAKSCRACFDYTNSLADVVVGYMGAPLVGNDAQMDESYQTLTIRNERGRAMVNTAIGTSRLAVEDIATGSGSHEWLASATVSSDVLVNAMIGGTVPEEGMPPWLGDIIGFGLRSVGPKGVSFARYSIDYHILRNYLFVLKQWGYERARTSIPQYSLDIVDHYVKTDKSLLKLATAIQAQEEEEGR